MSNEGMSYDEVMRRWFPSKWREMQRESQRKPFESDEDLDRRLMVAGMVKRALQAIRKALS